MYVYHEKFNQPSRSFFCRRRGKNADKNEGKRDLKSSAD